MSETNSLRNSRKKYWEKEPLLRKPVVVFLLSSYFVAGMFTQSPAQSLFLLYIFTVVWVGWFFWHETRRWLWLNPDDERAVRKILEYFSEENWDEVEE